MKKKIKFTYKPINPKKHHVGVLPSSIFLHIFLNEILSDVLSFPINCVA